MKLHELAHARAGDKGNTSDISVIAYAPGDYEFLREQVTAERVREHFADITRGPVERSSCPGSLRSSSCCTTPSAAAPPAPSTWTCTARA